MNEITGKIKENLLADGFEALLGMIYLDGGLRLFQKIIQKVILEPMNGFCKLDFVKSCQSLVIVAGSIQI